MVKGTVKEFKIRIKRNDKKLNAPLPTPLNHTGGVEVKLHSFLTSVIDGGEWQSSRAGRFTSGKEPRYPLKRGWVGIKPFWTVLEETKSLALAGFRTPDLSAPNLVTILTELTRLQNEVEGLIMGET